MLEHTPAYFGGEPVTLVKNFVRGLRPEIREHVILQQLPDFESALNIAKLKELVTLSSKSNNGQEVENLEELQFDPSEEEIKQSVGDEFNVWSTDFQNNGNRHIIANFDQTNLIVFVMGVAFSVKILNWAVMEVRNPALEACIGEQYALCFSQGKNWRSVKLAGAPIMCGSEPMMGALENSTSNNHSSVFFQF